MKFWNHSYVVIQGENVLACGLVPYCDTNPQANIFSRCITTYELWHQPASQCLYARVVEEMQLIHMTYAGKVFPNEHWDRNLFYYTLERTQTIL